MTAWRAIAVPLELGVVAWAWSTKAWAFNKRAALGVVTRSDDALCAFVDLACWVVCAGLGMTVVGAVFGG